MKKYTFIILINICFSCIAHGTGYYYNDSLPLIKVIDDTIYSVLDNIITEANKCNNLHSSTFIIEYNPLTGYYQIAGLMIFRVEESYRAWERAKSKGYFRYKGCQIVIVCQHDDAFSSGIPQSLFVNTEQYNKVSFYIPDSPEVYEEDGDVEHKLCWWYLYSTQNNTFKLIRYYDCLGNYYMYNLW